MDSKIYSIPNKAIVFHARNKPRMLEGQCHANQLKLDLENYNLHLYKVFTASSRIDCNPPFLARHNYVNYKKIANDILRLEAIDKENKNLVCKLNAITRYGPVVDCWNRYRRNFGKQRIADNLKFKRIMKENRTLLRTLLTSRSHYNVDVMHAHQKRYLTNFEIKIRMEKVLHIKKPLDSLLSNAPSISSGLHLPFEIPRKKAYMEFQIQNGVTLGRILVELYPDQAPKIVKNFLAHCNETAKHSYKNCRIHYGEKDKFLATGDVICQNGKNGHSIYEANIAAEENQLRATRQGILIAVPIYEPDKFDPKLTIEQRIRKPKVEPTYNSQFGIQVWPGDYHRGRAIIFGKVTKGNAVIGYINDMLKKCGTPLVPIIISKCGSIPYTKAESGQLKIVRASMKEANNEFEDNTGVKLSEQRQSVEKNNSEFSN